MRVAVAGYNAGMGGAMAGYRAGAVDSRTTGDDYSSDVFARRKTIATFLPVFVGAIKIGDVGIGGATSGGGGGRTIPGPVTDTGAKGPTKTGNGPLRGGTDKIVLDPDKMRSVAAFLDRTSNTLERDATLLKTQATKPAMPPHVRTNLLAEIAGIQYRMRTLWREADTWSEELKKRANRVDEPAGARSRKPGHAKVQRKPVLARGATGAMVKTLQRLLNKLGFGPLDVDGIFGPLTQAAVTRFQKAKKLEADGVVNQKDWAALLGAPSLPTKAPWRLPTECVPQGPGRRTREAGAHAEGRGPRAAGT